MLSIRLEQDVERELLALSADELSDRVQDSFVLWAEALGATRPLVLAIDDLHWADRTTRDLAERLLALTDRSAVMLATALRPDPGSQGWAFRLEAQTRFAHRVEELPLAPLKDEAARALIDELVPPGLVGEQVKDEVVAKAEGNPLYLEELLRALLETGGDRRRTWTITPKTAAELPPALEALLVARIDRLEPGARRLAQVAAVVGREFPVSVAAAVRAARTATSPSSCAPRSCARSVASPSSSARSATACSRRPRSRPSRRRRSASCTDASGTRWRRTWATRSTNVSNSWRSTSTGATRPTRASRTSSGPPSTRATVEALGRAEQLWERERRLADRIGDQDRMEHVDGKLAWLRKRSSGELPLPPEPETGGGAA
jgi:hypothetical protein